MSAPQMRSARLRVRDVMTSPVVTVLPETDVRDVVTTMLAHHVSGVPVVTAAAELVGIVTEGDLLHKESPASHGKPGSGDRPGAVTRTADKARGVMARELMTSPVVTVDEDTPLREAVGLMVSKQINRVPVMRGSQLVGIVARADALRALVRPDEEIAAAVREALLHGVRITLSGLRFWVRNGIVHLEGTLGSRAEKELAERWIAAIDGVVEVESRVTSGEGSADSTDKGHS